MRKPLGVPTDTCENLWGPLQGVQGIVPFNNRLVPVAHRAERAQMSKRLQVPPPPAEEVMDGLDVLCAAAASDDAQGQFSAEPGTTVNVQLLGRRTTMQMPAMRADQRARAGTIVREMFRVGNVDLVGWVTDMAGERNGVDAMAAMLNRCVRNMQQAVVCVTEMLRVRQTEEHVAPSADAIASHLQQQLTDMQAAMPIVRHIKNQQIPDYKPQVFVQLPQKGDGLQDAASTMLRPGEVEKCIMFMSTAYGTMKTLCGPTAQSQDLQELFVALALGFLQTCMTDEEKEAAKQRVAAAEPEPASPGENRHAQAVLAMLGYRTAAPLLKRHLYLLDLMTHFERTIDGEKNHIRDLFGGGAVEANGDSDTSIGHRRFSPSVAMLSEATLRQWGVDNPKKMRQDGKFKLVYYVKVAIFDKVGLTVSNTKDTKQLADSKYVLLVTPKQETRKRAAPQAIDTCARKNARDSAAGSGTGNTTPNLKELGFPWVGQMWEHGDAWA